VQLTATGAPYIVRQRPCSRCGGAGGSDKWAHTGWTCFDCGGNGRGGTEAVKLYSAEQLEKLNARKAKADAKKAAALAAKQAAVEAEIAARRAAFEAEYGALIKRAQAFAERSEFIADVIGKATDKAALTEAQAAALEAAIARIEATEAKKAASGYVGKVGERITLTVTAERMAAIGTQFGTMYIASMRDATGNAIVAKGSYIPTTANWNRETDRWEIDKETAFTIKATIKAHDTFRDEKQTIVQRVKEQEDKLHPRERSLVERVMAANPELTPEQALAMLRNAGM
jgi:hypothetical protein